MTMHDDIEDCNPITILLLLHHMHLPENQWPAWKVIHLTKLISELNVAFLLPIPSVITNIPKA